MQIRCQKGADIKMHKCLVGKLFTLVWYRIVKIEEKDAKLIMYLKKEFLNFLIQIKAI